MLKARNYLLAGVCCATLTVFASMGNTENIDWYIKSDINVFLWLFVAWLFE